MKKKNIYLFYFFTFLICIGTSSCSDDLQEQNETKKASIDELMNSDGFKSALNVIKKFKKAVDSTNPQLRSSEGIIVESVEKTTFNFDINNVKQNQLKSTNSEKDTTNKTSVDLYTINFKHGDKKGYSIVTGDERVERIYAYVESGQLSDTTYNVGLSFMIASIPDIVEDDIEEYYLQAGGIPINDPTICTSTNTWDPTLIGNRAWPGRSMETEWNQNAPYNLNMPAKPTNCNLDPSYAGKCPAGCVAVAVAQLIINRCSYTPKGSLYDLQTLRSLKTILPTDISNATKVGVFLDSVGKGCNTTYGCESVADFYSPTDYLREEWGLNANYIVGTIDWKKVFFSLFNKGCPTIIGGIKTNGGGHAWVVDDIKCEWKSCSLFPSTLSDITSFKPISVHCNWGWGVSTTGGSNGWFAISSYNIAKTGKEYIKNPQAIYFIGN